jgi:Membrane bound beta barrel domain (DUF5777)
VPRSPQLDPLAPLALPCTAGWRAALAVGVLALILSWTVPGAAAAASAGAPPDAAAGTAAQEAPAVPAEAPAVTPPPPADASPPAPPPAEAAAPAETSPPAGAASPAGTPPPAETSPPASAAAPAGAVPADEPYVVPAHRPDAGELVGSRLIDVATPFTIGRRRLELLFTHRFDQPVNQGANAHNLWGLDSGADVGIGFTYGVLRRLDLSVYRSQFQEDYELAGKLQVLDQSPRVPLSAAVRAGANLLGRIGVADPHRPFAQLLLGRDLAPGWNLFLSPSWVRATPLLHNAWNVPVGLTLPLPGKWLLDGEVIPANHALRDMPGASRLAWHAAFAKQIGGHRFQIVLGNSRATTLDQIVGGDFAGGFTTHDLRLGFNLLRYFSL